MNLLKLIILFICSSLPSFSHALPITLAKNIDVKISDVFKADLDFLAQLQFNHSDNSELSKIMNLSQTSNQSITDWLEERIHYVVSSSALSPINVSLYRGLVVEQENVIFPNAEIIPYSQDSKLLNRMQAKTEDSDREEDSSSIQLINISSAIYISGKQEKKLYALKINNGFFKASQKVVIDSPRAGIIQVGAGFLSTFITSKRKKIKAPANSIFRLANLFHEARHSDGNGESLAFTHIICPRGHDYEGAKACDESLNGPYAVGANMLNEMVKECEESCSVMDKEALLLATYDYFNRILPKTHKGDKTKAWDPTPESL
jgi:hypothetical protein